MAIAIGIGIGVFAAIVSALLFFRERSIASQFENDGDTEREWHPDPTGLGLDGALRSNNRPNPSNRQQQSEAIESVEMAGPLSNGNSITQSPIAQARFDEIILDARDDPALMSAIMLMEQRIRDQVSQQQVSGNQDDTGHVGQKSI